jgi:hypothetical protein
MPSSSASAEASERVDGRSDDRLVGRGVVGAGVGAGESLRADRLLGEAARSDSSSDDADASWNAYCAKM